MSRKIEGSALGRQLALDLELDVTASFDTFLADGNDEALAALIRVSHGEDSQPLWICGPRSSGKSHLLQAACRAATDRGARAMYVPLARAQQFEPEILRGCEALDLLTVDDVDAVAGDAHWEAALFAAVNESLLNGLPLVLAARPAPREVGFELADLRSRADAHIVYRIAALGDDGLETLLGRRALERGLSFDPGAFRYLLRRVRRDMRVLDDWLSRLDAASLAAQRRVTVALVRSVLEQGPDGPG
jgi:DnaA family protein